ncbi:MAG: hypothetical protein OHK0046_13550 [Anaerolineae bacterium]
MWQSLYSSCVDREQLLHTVHRALGELGYTLYNPFSLTPGKAYADTIKVFVAPAAKGWIRLVGNAPEAFTQSISALGLCLDAHLEANRSHLAAYAHGERVPLETVLPQNLTAASSAATSPQHADVPYHALPEDVQRMAQDLNPKQINKMFNRLMGRVNRQLGGEAQAAQTLLQSGADWTSEAGTRLLAQLEALQLPHEPDFITLRDAYQRHHRQQAHPNAPLYPGDAEVMHAVPDALAYTPVYGGR